MARTTRIRCKRTLQCTRICACPSSVWKPFAKPRAASARSPAGLPSSTCLILLGRPLLLKCEPQQPGGAFKIRGATNMLMRLSDDQRRRGRHHVLVGQPRSGGGARGVAARRARRHRHADDDARDQGRRREAVGRGGIFEGTTSNDRRARAEKEAAARGLTMVPPFDHEWIIEGQGTCGLEILEQVAGRRHHRRAHRRRRAGVGRGGRGEAVGVEGEGRRRRAGRRGQDDGVARRRPPGHARAHGVDRGRADARAARRPHVRARAGVRRRGRDRRRTTRSREPRSGCSTRRSRSSSRAARRRSPR